MKKMILVFLFATIAFTPIMAEPGSKKITLPSLPAFTKLFTKDTSKVVTLSDDKQAKIALKTAKDAEKATKAAAAKVEKDKLLAVKNEQKAIKKAAAKAKKEALKVGTPLPTDVPQTASQNETSLLTKPVNKYAKRFLSFGLSGAIVADMSGLGGAIADTGVIDTHKLSLANKAGIAKLILSDKDMATVWYSSAQTAAGPLQGISSFTPGGPLIGVDTGGTLMVDFLPFKVPLFIKAGFDYSKNISGGAQRWTLGKGPDQVAATGGFPIPAGGFEGGTMKVNWNASWMEIPVTVGGIWGIPGVGKVYGGLGASYFRGGFAIGVDADAKYASFLTSFVGRPELMVQEPIRENIEFITKGISINMLLGTEVTIKGPFAFYCEYYMGGTMLTEFAQGEFNGSGKKGMTLIMGGPDAAALDPDYIERFAYPTLLGGSTIKFGLKYYIF